MLRQMPVRNTLPARTENNAQNEHHRHFQCRRSGFINTGLTISSDCWRRRVKEDDYSRFPLIFILLDNDGGDQLSPGTIPPVQLLSELFSSKHRTIFSIKWIGDYKLFPLIERKLRLVIWQTYFLKCYLLPQEPHLTMVPGDIVFVASITYRGFTLHFIVYFVSI